MRCLTLLILIMTGLMDLFRRRPRPARGQPAPAPKLRCAPSRLASCPGGQAGHPACRQGRPGPGRMAVPCRNAAHRRTRHRRQPAPAPREHLRNTTVHTRRGPPTTTAPGPAAQRRQDYTQQRETPTQQSKIAQNADSGASPWPGHSPARASFCVPAEPVQRLAVPGRVTGFEPAASSP
jgi:hypothetical protein